MAKFRVDLRIRCLKNIKILVEIFLPIIIYREIFCLLTHLLGRDKYTVFTSKK